MEIDAKDILAYLVVLDSPLTKTELTFEEIDIGRANILGCYHRLMTSLELNTFDGICRQLYLVISQREMFNSKMMLPISDQRLIDSTNLAAKQLIEFLRGRIVTDSVKQKFVKKLKDELSRICDSY